VNVVPFIKFHSVLTKPGRSKKPVLVPRALSSGSPSYGFVVEPRVLQTCSHMLDASNSIHLQVSGKLEYSSYIPLCPKYISH